MAVLLGAIKKARKKMILYKSFGKYLTSKNGDEVYIYDNGILYDTDKFGNKSTSHRMSRLNLTIL